MHSMEGTSAHLEFLGLREQPFAPTADPAYFYAAGQHKECLFRLWNSIDERHGIAVVLGNYGTGKTTLLRKLLTGMHADSDRYRTAVLGSPIPSWTSFALLENIVGQFGLALSSQSFGEYMETLNRYLLSNRNRICTLIVDDAQNLNKRGQIELLRLVQNLETQQHKLLNLVFFGQLEWAQVLRAAPNFLQRVNMTYRLEALGLEDVRNFIEFRLFQAGANEGGGPVFNELALRVIHAYSDGNPREMVTLCRNALIVAGQMRTREIGYEILLHTIEKTTLPDPERKARVARVVPGAGANRKPRAERVPVGARHQSDVIKQEASVDREQMSRDQKAAQMLLKAAQARRNQG